MTRLSWWWLARGRRSRDRRRPWLRREQAPVCKVVKFQEWWLCIWEWGRRLDPCFDFDEKDEDILKMAIRPWFSWGELWPSRSAAFDPRSGFHLPLSPAFVTFVTFADLRDFHICDTVLTVAIWIMRYVFKSNCVVLYQLSSSFFWQSWNWFS